MLARFQFDNNDLAGYWVVRALQLAFLLGLRGRLAVAVANFHCVVTVLIHVNKGYVVIRVIRQLDHELDVRARFCSFSRRTNREREYLSGGLNKSANRQCKDTHEEQYDNAKPHGTTRSPNSTSAQSEPNHWERLSFTPSIANLNLSRFSPQCLVSRASSTGRCNTLLKFT